MKKSYKIVVVINENARGGSTRDFLHENLYKLIEAFQKESGYQIAMLFSRSREHLAKSIVSLQNQGYNVFVTYGGDGTINDTIQELNEGTFLIPISAGNANDFAARLNIRNTDDVQVAFQDVLAMLEDLISGRLNIIGLDIGEIQFSDASGNLRRKRFANNLGLGVTAQTVKQVEGQVKKNYVLSGLQAILAAKALKMHYLTTFSDEESQIDCLGVEALLCRKVGNYAFMAPFKRENNEALQLFVINNMSWWFRLMFVVAVKFGTWATKFGMGSYFHDKRGKDKQNQYSMTLEGLSSLTLRLEELTPLHVDGNMVPEFEELIQKKFTIRILPKFIRTIAPC